MIYLFTTSKRIGAKLIRWGTGSSISHMAISASKNLDSLVVQSNLSKGVHETTLAKFLEHYEMVIAFETSGELPSRFFEVRKMVGKHYDWKGIGYYAIAVLWFKKILRRKLPFKNKWADKNDFYCSELVYSNESFLRSLEVDLDRYGKQMLSPDRAAEILGEVFKEVKVN